MSNIYTVQNLSGRPNMSSKPQIDVLYEPDKLKLKGNWHIKH